MPAETCVGKHFSTGSKPIAAVDSALILIGIKCYAAEDGSAAGANGEGPPAGRERVLEQNETAPVLNRLVRNVCWLAAQVCLQAGLVVACFLALDLVCFVLSPLTIGTSTDRTLSIDNRARVIAGYSQIRWLRDWYLTYNHVKVRWHPYSYWMMSPFKSRYINIDSNNVRATWQESRKPPTAGVRALKISMFGGSTMFGTNARDDYTIPSILAQRLTSSIATPISVTNFGQMDMPVRRRFCF